VGSRAGFDFLKKKNFALAEIQTPVVQQVDRRYTEFLSRNQNINTNGYFEI
jgi:hypothetical protein